MPSGPKKRRSAKKKGTEKSSYLNNEICNQDEVTSKTSSPAIDEGVTVSEAAPPLPLDDQVQGKYDISEVEIVPVVDASKKEMSPVGLNPGDNIVSGDIPELCLKENVESLAAEGTTSNVELAMIEVQSAAEETSKSVWLENVGIFLEQNPSGADQLERVKKTVTEELRAAEKTRAFLQKVLDDLNAIQLTDEK